MRTVLANEEVVDGKSEVGGFPVERRNLRQWVLRITAYADRLLSGLDGVDWPDSTKRMQAAWIGRSEGAEIVFGLEDPALGGLKVFTTRPDTLFGCTYMVLAPEHALVGALTAPERRAAVDAYRRKAASKSDLERTDLAKDKTGVFTGSYAVNPVNGAHQSTALLLGGNAIVPIRRSQRDNPRRTRRRIPKLFPGWDHCKRHDPSTRRDSDWIIPYRYR